MQKFSGAKIALSVRTVWLLGVATAVFCPISYCLLDKEAILLASKAPHGVTLFFEAATHLGDSLYTIAITAIVWFVAYLKNNAALRQKALFVLTSVAVSGLIVDLVKVLSGRPRPKMWLQQQLYSFDPLRFGWDFTSFPSGHAATAAALAVTLGLLFARQRLWIWLLFGLVALSRLFTLSHYPSDIVVGAFIGVATALFARKIFKSV